MRIGLVAPIFEPVPPVRHGGTERTVAMLADALLQRGHNVTVFASGDSQTRAPLLATVPRALRYADSSIDPTTATLVHLPELYDRASEFDVIHNHVGPLAFPFMRSSPVPTLTTVYGGLDRVEVRRAFEVFAEQPLVATSWAQRAVLSGSDWRATIHGAVDLRQFHFRADPGEYLAYVGRVGPEQRLEWAIDPGVRGGSAPGDRELGRHLRTRLSLRPVSAAPHAWRIWRRSKNGKGRTSGRRVRIPLSGG
jgi:glycosyltransferase involved in cell wall biosynthesis